MKMINRLPLATVISGFGAFSLMLSLGCTQQEATETMKQAEESAQQTAESIKQDAGEMVEKGEQMASELGEKATAFLSPLKEKFGNLDSLKDKPEELKKAVADLIQSIEAKAEGIQLPESVNNTLAAVKEKLVALRDYLEGEFEQANVDEQVQGIMDSVESGLGMQEQ
jgi:vacuolar-type H+-ATPase subunit H